MGGFSPQRMIDFFLNLPLAWTIVWVGLAALTIALFVLMRTRWGQSKPLRKCAVLSLFAHVLLACVATSVKIVHDTAGSPTSQEVRVTLAADSSDAADAEETTATKAQPWESLDAPEAELPESDPQRIAAQESPLERNAKLPEEGHSGLSDLQSRLPNDPRPQPQQPDTKPNRSTTDHAPTPIEPPKAQQRHVEATNVPDTELDRTHEDHSSEVDRQRNVNAPDSALAELAAIPRAHLPTSADVGAALPSLTDQLRRSTSPVPASAPEQSAASMTADSESAGKEPSDQQAEDGSQSPDPGESKESAHQPPPLYQQRIAPDRKQIVQRRGGGPETEASVEAALRWLAANQANDGSWASAEHGGGKEQRVFGESRDNAGARADTAMTGIALLAFLGAGHTQQEGKYQTTVQKGLDYLRSVQAADGNIYGDARLFARMYCHGIATFALSEAYAMTGDPQIQIPVKAAINFTIAAQHSGGGWRYQPGDPGDTSQLGWQLMSLRSAELAGLAIPDRTRRGMTRFLDDVSRGTHKGYAGYRPNHPISRTMTAEALFCRQLLGHMPSRHTGNEAASFVLRELPGKGKPNFYYWYYATLALYQLQGPAWDQWNAALKPALIDSQRRDGLEAGSWDPTTVWGGYGGRVYTTALGALCLEVYYRYLPLYAETARAQSLLR